MTIGLDAFGRVIVLVYTWRGRARKADLGTQSHATRAGVEKAGGGNYQSLINEALREHIAHSQEPLEATLRRVIREEVRRIS